jgi:apolipoprotein N-acyltransferase
MIRFRVWQCHVSMPILGVILTLAFAPYDYGYAAIAALGSLYLCSSSLQWKQAMLLGYLFGLGLFGSGVWWVYISVHDFGGADSVSATLLTMLLASFCALFPALTLALIAKLPKPIGLWSRIFAAALIWIGVEYFRGYLLLNGFPWLQIAYSQLATPLAGFAPLLGVYGVGFLLAASAFALAEAIRHKLPIWQLLVFWIVVWGGGGWLKTVQWTHASGEPFEVTLVQGNVEQGQKWLPDQKLNTLRLYQQLTEQHWDSDVIIWPETAIPAFLSQVKEFYLDPLAEQAKQHNVDLVVSLPSGGNKIYYNSMLVLSDSNTLYHKNHLLPFGEYLPLQPLSGWVLDQLQIPLGNFTPGVDNQKLLRAGGYPFVSTICYEDAFGEQVIGQLDEAAYLVNVTNDAWFGDSSQPHQHMQMAQMRALETGRYLVRVTNTGLSGFVAPDGSLFKQAPMFTTTTLTDKIVPMSGMTPYALLGDKWVLLLLSLLTAITFACESVFVRLRK